MAAHNYINCIIVSHSCEFVEKSVWMVEKKKQWFGRSEEENQNIKWKKTKLKRNCALLPCMQCVKNQFYILKHTLILIFLK